MPEGGGRVAYFLTNASKQGFCVGCPVFDHLDRRLMQHFRIHVPPMIGRFSTGRDLMGVGRFITDLRLLLGFSLCLGLNIQYGISLIHVIDVAVRLRYFCYIISPAVV